jgi:hypothetical protein
MQDNEAQLNKQANYAKIFCRITLSKDAHNL